METATRPLTVDALEEAGEKDECQPETPTFEDLNIQVLRIQKGAYSRGAKISELKTLFTEHSDQGYGDLATLDLFTATFGIKRGIILEALNGVVSQREKWGPWLEDNFPALKQRAVNNWRSMARRRDCHRHARLGEARLLKLLSLTKDFAGDDPFTDFLKAAEVEYDPAWEILSAETKNQIDKAIEQALQNRDKKVLRDFRTQVDKLIAKTAELSEDADSLKKVDVEKLQELRDNLNGLIEQAKS